MRSRAGSRLTLVAAGGIDSAEEAWQRLRAGANLIQVYTAFIYEGPALPSRIAFGLLERARAEGFANLAKAIEYHHAESAAGSSEAWAATAHQALPPR